MKPCLPLGLYDLEQTGESQFPQPLCQFRSRIATIGAQLLYRRGLCQQFQDGFRDTFGHIN